MQSRDFVSVATVWCVLLISGITATITEGPSNTVAEIGEQVQLNCTTDQNDMANINWFLSMDGVSGNVQIVGDGCEVNSGFEDHYQTEIPNSDTMCNLVVYNTTMEQAGVYTCREEGNAVSVLTVIETPPIISVGTSTDVVHNEPVLIECSLVHNGSIEPGPTLRPYFYWTDSTGMNVSSYYDSTTENTTLSQFIIRAGRGNISSYTCHVYLQLIPTTNPDYAGNTPSVNSSASSPIIEVLYIPYIYGFESYRPNITIGGTTCTVWVVTCLADGNPPPKYEWFDQKANVTLSNDATLDLAELGRTYVCYAYNTILNSTSRDVQGFVPTGGDITQYCRFPHYETTWTNVTYVDDCNNGTCACSDEHDSLTLTCNADTFPDASYKWIGPDNSVFNCQVLTNVTTNGIYRCIAYFDSTTSNYTGDVMFPNGTSVENVTECYPFKKPENVLPPEMTDLLNGT